VESLTEHVYLYRAMKAAYLRLLLRDAPQARVPRVSPDEYADNLRAIVGECRKSGVQPVFLELPHRRRAGEPLAQSAYPDVLAAVAAEMRVPLISVGELGLRATAVSNEQYFIDTLHLSPRGHELMARLVAEGLRRSGVL
jgi:lysophospholipase L1-like esterase